MDPIALSIPIFFVLIGIELIVGILQKRKLYRLNDALTNLSCGIGSQILGAYFKVVIFMAYVFIYDNWRVIDLPNEWWAWLICFIGVDFFYYWFHRLSHEINFIWATHIVHHQSEEYNLSVALRQSWFQGLISWAFYITLAIAGFNPLMIVTIGAFNTLYQFWIHTRLIGKMGPLEWILNTPSHHRVHHGSEPKYIDKNHAGTLIIWDRMFGTFQEEEEEPIYGITRSFNSWNPVWANFHYWKELWDISQQASNWKDKLKVYVKPPGWQPRELGGFRPPQGIDKARYQKYDTKLSKPLAWYLFFQFILLIGFTSYFMFTNSMMWSEGPSIVIQYSALAVLIIFMMFSIGLGLENDTRFEYFEPLRILLQLVFLFYFLSGYWPWAGVAISLISMVHYWSIKNEIHEVQV
jgi:sterol desaturase/sphingolipid hydroxylase (fatty acid hydroxylase superfamily)